MTKTEKKLRRIKSFISDLPPEFDPQRWLERATDMIQERPAVTLAVAVGTGVVLGMTLFNKLGRVLLIGTLGIATEVLLKRMMGGEEALAD